VEKDGRLRIYLAEAQDAGRYECFYLVDDKSFYIGGAEIATQSVGGAYTEGLVTFVKTPAIPFIAAYELVAGVFG